MWLESILSGITLGLVLAMLIGPVFFLLIDTGITRGFKAAAFIAAGVMLSDAFFILIAYYSSTANRFMEGHQQAIGIGGGVILMVFGIVTMLSKPKLQLETIQHGRLSADWKGLPKGFILNLFNPFVLIFWMGVAGSVATGPHHDPKYTILFFVMALITIFSTDLLKAWGAARLKKFIRPRFLQWLNWLSGAGLIAFGVRLIWKLL